MAEKSPIVPEVTMSASEVRQHFSEVVNRVARGEDRVLVEKHGAPAVAVVSLEDARRLRVLDRQMRERQALLDAFREPFKDIPDEELEREIQKALAEVKEDRRREREAARRNEVEKDEIGAAR
jgi:prevent-host-death family protein